jgi:hypothetical protein
MLNRSLAGSLRLIALLLFCGVSVGCGSASKSKVSGQVNLDGRPATRGLITFEPVDGNGQSAGIGLDGQGAYSLPMSPGKKKVIIALSKVVGQRQVYQGDPNSPVIDDLAPVDFTSLSPLEIEIAPGASRQDFELQTAAAGS